MAEKVVGIIAEWNPFHRGHEDMSIRFERIMVILSSWPS